MDALGAGNKELARFLLLTTLIGIPTSHSLAPIHYHSPIPVNSHSNSGDLREQIQGRVRGCILYDGSDGD